MVDDKDGSATRKPQVLIVLAFILLAGSFLRLRGLGNSSFWLDEFYTLQHAHKALEQIPASLRQSGAHPPLYFFLTHMVLSLGDGEWAVRFPVALTGIVTVAVMYLLGKRAHGETAGVAAAALLAVSPFHIHFSQEARMYPQLALLSLLQLYSVWRAMEQGHRRWWLLFAVATALSLYTHYFAMLATAGTVLFALFWTGMRWGARRRMVARKALFSLVLSCALAAGAYAPWLPAMQQNLFDRQEAKGEALGQSGLSLSWSLAAEMVREFGGGVNPAALLLSGAALMGIVVLVVGRERDLVSLTASWVLPVLAAIVVFDPRKFNARYVSYLQALYVSLAAVGLTAAVSAVVRACNLAKGRGRPAALLAAALALYAAVSVAAIGEYDPWNQTNWHEVVDYVLDRLGPGDVILADGVTYMGWGDCGRVTDMLARYPQIETRGVLVMSEANVARGIRTLPARDGRVLAVIYRGQVGLRRDPEVELQYLDKVAMVELKQPAGGIGDNVLEMLEALTRVQSREDARFGLHLALAEIYQATGDVEMASAHMAAARDTEPGRFDPERGLGSDAYRRLGLDQ